MLEKNNTGAPAATSGEAPDLLTEVADVLAENNWRGDLQERLREAVRIESAAAPTPTGTDDFMVFGRAGNRRADLEAKLRDVLADSIESAAAPAPIPTFKPWTERMGVGVGEMVWPHEAWPHLKAEILELRAAVYAATKPTADLIPVPRATLEKISDAMNHMGDQLNEIDAVEEEDEAICTPAFEAVQSLLATKPAAQADRNDILEEAAKLCEEMEDDMFDQYKGRGKHAPNNPYRADPYMNGQSDGAGRCAIAIRKLMRNPAAAPAAPLSADAAQEQVPLSISGSVCEVGELEDEGGDHGIRIEREFNFVTIKGLYPDEVRALAPLLFGDVAVSFGIPAAGAEGAA